MEVLDMTNDQAKTFFMKNESYLSNSLPNYLNFEPILNDVDSKMAGKKLEDIKKDWPSNYEGVNFKIKEVKKGKYDWRALQLIHPVLYIELLKIMTKETNWNLIKNHLSKVCCVELTSLPVDSDGSLKAAQILKWQKLYQEKSLELSIEYKYMFETDITGCYDEIYTHSIPWALHGKTMAKEQQRNKTLLGNQIDKLIQGMSYGQTNGIPQGSILMDLISEIILKYVDTELDEKLTNLNETYKVLRYRDDYRIFVKEKWVGEKIIKALVDVLHDLGLKINYSKTKFYDSIIGGIIKEEKIEWGKVREERSFYKNLFLLRDFNEKYPGNSIVYEELKKVSKKIDEILADGKEIKNYELAFLIDIAVRNPRIYPKIIQQLKKIEIENERLDKIITKLKTEINSDLVEVWLQRLKINSETENKLARIALGEQVDLWNNDWIKDDEEALKVTFNKTLEGEVDSQELLDEEVEIFFYTM